MMKLIKLLYLFALFSTLMGCEKQNTVVNNQQIFDTTKPLSYFPVYPGSYWNYLVNDSVNYSQSTSQQYLPHSYLGAEGFTDTAYVPFLNGNPIYAYSKIEWLEAPFGNYYQKWPILSEKVGETFTRDWGDTRYGDFLEHLVVAEKKQVGSDSIIILKGHWVLGHNTSKISYQEYVKNVGLTKHFEVDTVLNDTVYKKVLVNYFIND